MEKRKVRSFLAIELNESLYKKIEDAQEVLVSPNFKKVKPENVHLTVKFLGYSEYQLLRKVAESLAPELKKIPPFDFRVSTAGGFPSVKNCRVVWYALEKLPRELKDLKSVVEDITEHYGFERENKDFVPHITLGRFKKPQNIAHLIDKLGEFTRDKPEVEVNSIILFESILKPEGPEYRPLFKIGLGTGSIIEI